MLEREKAICRIREFNRFYMPRLGLLGNHYLGSSYSPTEARVLFEVYENDGCNAAYIAKRMNIDKSYLSRIIRAHEKSGYLTRGVSSKDSRSFNIHLTALGIERTEACIKKFNQQIGEIIETLSEEECSRLIKSFNTITDILKAHKTQRQSGEITMKIVPYDKKYKNTFIEMNKQWISKMFVIEEEDLAVLNNIEQAIDAGGQIFFAVDDSDEVLACCMIAPLPNGEWEIEKFCARGMYTGTGAGSACLKACIDYAKKKHVEKIVIVTNRKCEQAIHLYNKFGFVEVPVDKEKFPFERANVAFEQSFTYA